MKFLKYVLATFVGLILFSLITFLILVGIIGSVASEKEVEIADKSVLHLKLDKPIVERASDDPLSELEIGAFGGKGSIGLIETKEAIEKAKTDPKIKGIFLDINYVITGFASIEEIRNSLIDFKESGKFLIAYGEIYSEGGYYLASVADKIFLNPMGELELNGLTAELLFFKGTLDKLGIQPQIFKVGEFKSAVEPLVLDKMSEANKLQYASFLNSINDHLISGIAKARKIDVRKLRIVSDSMLVQMPDDALKYELITDIGYFDEVQEWMKSKLSLKSTKDIKLVSLKTYRKAPKDISKPSSKNKIAVIVAEGQIMKEKNGNEGISSDEIAEELRKARLDKNVKAVVLRINSPGGSALASDVMWREVVLTKKVKPIIASMSDYSASGGYYMAMGCNKIVAHPSTITGSIGIFGVLFNMESFLEEKLGITSDRVKTGKFSDLITVTRPLTKFEKSIIQKNVEEGYNKFITKAAQGRNISKDSLDKIASGRVWSGAEALKVGLVDELGGLQDAIRIAAKSAKLGEDYKVRYYPEKKSFIENLIVELGGEVETRLVQKEFGALTPYVTELQKLKAMEGIQARIPYQMILN
ncbi:MAG TPA: signal peptide peptidase SppA [Cytophagales bacterium]|nr:signal peptide peptidase SppA [Cytophagales bacterium]